MQLTLNLTPEQIDILQRALISYGVKHAEARNRAAKDKQPHLQAEHDMLVRESAAISAQVRGQTQDA